MDPTALFSPNLTHRQTIRGRRRRKSDSHKESLNIDLHKNKDNGVRTNVSKDLGAKPQSSSTKSDSASHRPCPKDNKRPIAPTKATDIKEGNKRARKLKCSPPQSPSSSRKTTSTLSNFRIPKKTKSTMVCKNISATLVQLTADKREVTSRQGDNKPGNDEILRRSNTFDKGIGNRRKSAIIDDLFKQSNKLPQTSKTEAVKRDLKTAKGVVQSKPSIVSPLLRRERRRTKSKEFLNWSSGSDSAQRNYSNLNSCQTNSDKQKARKFENNDKTAILQNVANPLREEEAMEFDNPLPEILQMVTENCLSIPKKEEFTDAMEVDIFPDLRKQLLLIPDTNVWIEKLGLGLLEDLLSTEFQTGMYPIIVIPWMVLQEIDHNIHKRKDCSEFRRAAKFIHSLLSAKHPRVKGQKATDAIIGMEFSELMADDSILNCALQHSKLQQFMTVFITNDINLLNKTLVHDISAFKADQYLIGTIRKLFLANVKPDSFESPAKTHGSPLSSDAFSFSRTPELSQRNIEPIFESVVGNDCGMEIDDPMGEEVSTGTKHTTDSTSIPISPTFEDVVLSLKQALTNVIVPRMVEEYGEEGWKFAIKIKPPFSVDSALKCIQLHWIAVFSFVFPSRAKDILDELVKVFRTKPQAHDENSILAWRNTICELALKLLSMSDKLRFKARILQCCELLKRFSQHH